MSKLVQINSKDRVSPDTTTASDFRVNLGNDGRISSVKAISVKEIQFVNSFTNINVNNNKLYYTTGGVEDFVEVSPGQYTFDELSPVLIAAFGAKSITFTTGIGDTTKRLTFTSTPAISYNKYKLDGSKNPMARVLGIASADVVEYNALVATSLPDLSGIKSVYVCSPQLSGGQFISSNTLGSVLDVVPVTVPFGSFVSHSGEAGGSDSHVYANELQNNLSTIDIQLRDEDNQLLDCNGTEFVCILKIYT